jgi:hypothetical protein
MTITGVGSGPIVGAISLARPEASAVLGSRVLSNSAINLATELMTGLGV